MRRPRPLKRIDIPLRDGVSVALVVWRRLEDLRAHPEAAANDQAFFLEQPDGPSIGELHIDRTASASLIAHELRHAIDYYTYRQHTEQSARMTQECMATIEAIIEEL